MIRALLIRSILAVLAACVGSTGPASAFGPDECDLPSNVEISACMAMLYKHADAELNVVYKRALASIEQAGYIEAEEREEWQASLRKAQQTWIEFKELDCGELIFYEWWGGSGAGIASLGCQIDATRRRTNDLKSRYQID